MNVAPISSISGKEYAENIGRYLLLWVSQQRDLSLLGREMPFSDEALDNMTNACQELKESCLVADLGQIEQETLEFAQELSSKNPKCLVLCGRTMTWKISSVSLSGEMEFDSRAFLPHHYLGATLYIKQKEIGLVEGDGLLLDSSVRGEDWQFFYAFALMRYLNGGQVRVLRPLFWPQGNKGGEWFFDQMRAAFGHLSFEGKDSKNILYYIEPKFYPESSYFDFIVYPEVHNGLWERWQQHMRGFWVRYRICDADNKAYVNANIVSDDNKLLSWDALI